MYGNKWWNVGFLLAVANLIHGMLYPVPDDHKNRDWMQFGQDELKRALGLEQNKNVAKNVVLFLGDGLGFTTIWAARLYTGQTLHQQSGEEYEFEFEKFSHVGLSKTYNTESQVSDSAGTATAFLCGVKASAQTLGVNQNVVKKNCTNQAENSVESILDWSLAKGKSVGLVTTTRLTHATPAASYAQSANRHWETDIDIENPANGDVEETKRHGCKDIARQLTEDNLNINVVLGGGRSKFYPKEFSDPEHSTPGARGDGRNLIEEWKSNQTLLGHKSAFVYNKEQLDAVNIEETDYLFGLFEPSHMQYEQDRDPNTDPSLAEMSAKAIELLQKNEKGFFLLIEGGRIDHAHHDGTAGRALHETMAMDEAVKVVQEMTSDEDTLIVVTADHSHAFTTSGYPSRGNPILGTSDRPELQPPLDDMPSLTLTYANGPGAIQDGRKNLTGVNTTYNTYIQDAIVPMKDETHGGEDVPIYAQGPMAHLFHGVHEQNYIAHVMAYASCVGPNQDHCNNNPDTSSGPCLKAALKYDIMALALISIIYATFIQ